MKRLLTLLIALVPFVVLAQEEQETDRQKKLIGKYTAILPDHFVWPEEGKYGDFVIGVVGSRTVANDIRIKIAQHGFADQVMLAKHFNSPDELEKETELKMVVVPAGFEDQLPAVLKVLGDLPVVVISQRASLPKGADFMVNIRFDDQGKLEIKVKEEAFLQRRMKVSDRIYAISERVR